MEVRTERELVRAHLKGRDVPCPGCAYNLRDGDGGPCPECGRTARLAELRASVPAGARQRAKAAMQRVLMLVGLTALLWILVIVAMGVSKSGDGQASFVLFGPCAVTPVSVGLIVGESIASARRSSRPKPASGPGDAALLSWMWCSLLIIACAFTLWTIVTGQGLS